MIATFTEVKLGMGRSSGWLVMFDDRFIAVLGRLPKKREVFLSYAEDPPWAGHWMSWRDLDTAKAEFEEYCKLYSCGISLEKIGSPWARTRRDNQQKDPAT